MPNNAYRSERVFHRKRHKVGSAMAMATRIGVQDTTGHRRQTGLGFAHRSGSLLVKAH